MTGPTTTAPARPDQPQARPSSHTIARTVLRAAGTVVALIVVYYLLPLDHASEPAAIAMLIIGLVAFIALVTFHVRSILRSPFPQRRAVEALAINIPLFLLLFAATYVVLATISTSNFGQHLSHTDGLYFTVTVFSTVGFGDITAKTETARLVVTGQMIADLIILGLAIKIILGAVKSRQATDHPRTAPEPTRQAMSRADDDSADGGRAEDNRGR
jgi:voltage-gated potassium channel